MQKRCPKSKERREFYAYSLLTFIVLVFLCILGERYFNNRREGLIGKRMGENERTEEIREEFEEIGRGWWRIEQLL